MNRSAQSKQAVDFYAFPTRIDRILRIRRPPLQDPQDAFVQLRYLETHLKHLGCQSIAVERHYIDRDFVDDHSYFYGKSLESYPNYCQRIHFFKTALRDTKREIASLPGKQAFLRACERFSRRTYLGFSVIKPLPGSPLGRTVIRPITRANSLSEAITFPTLRMYKAHFLGIELSVHGLAFQQQDTGVSACATTAIWCSLHKLREQEDLPRTTPARITALASQFTLPHGRATPSEGLSIDQMCQAINAIELSPNLYRINDNESAKAYIYAALRSGIPPILIIERNDECHAIVAVGMVVPKVRTTNKTLSLPGFDARANDLLSFYVHDDRVGPYVHAEIDDQDPFRILLKAKIGHRLFEDTPWLITHAIIPTHHKVRLSFSQLRTLTNDISDHLQAIYEHEYRKTNAVFTFESRILRSPDYIEELRSKRPIGLSRLRNLTTKTRFPRYIGVIQITSKTEGGVDVLLDTTSTLRNVSYLGMILFNPSSRQLRDALELLSTECNCAVLAKEGR